ncbi:MAG: nucleotidyltransferase domain-containing protein [Ignavibacteria bacterium]|nr:nucleotidyltransferase domain-containing protein [Ignavibacteria bacterium]
MTQTELNKNSHYVDIKNIKVEILKIVKYFQPEKIILFGSYAKGNPEPDSDVDLLVIIETKKSTWDISVEISIMLKHSFPIDIVVRTPKEINKRLNHGDYFIKDIIENGKILYERNH